MARIAHSVEIARNKSMQNNRYCNILIDSLPETVVVSGRECVINTDFRVGVLFEQMAFDTNVDKFSLIAQSLRLYYGETVPSDIPAAIDGMLWFYKCGYEAEPKRKTTKDSTNKDIKERIFDYDIDAQLIYAAFISQYNIDLQDVNALHWWKFSAMFRGLKEDERICEIMGYRAIDLSKIKDKAEKARYARLKAKHALPNPLSEEQKVELAGYVFSGGIHK